MAELVVEEGRTMRAQAYADVTDAFGALDTRVSVNLLVGVSSRGVSEITDSPISNSWEEV